MATAWTVSGQHADDGPVIATGVQAWHEKVSPASCSQTLKYRFTFLYPSPQSHLHGVGFAGPSDDQG